MTEPETSGVTLAADNLDEVRKAFDGAAAASGAVWLSYLFTGFYLAIAAGAVTHEGLFFQQPIKLPFLNIELPLIAFFTLAPILFVIIHAYTLVHFVMLSDKAKDFHQTLREEACDSEVPIRRRLPTNIFVQFLAGPAPTDRRQKLFRWLLQAIVWLTLVIAPVLLLLLMEVKFLPFHSSIVAWTQRIVLGVDLVLLWLLWSMILSGRQVESHRRGRSGVRSGAGFLLTACAFLFWCAMATFPGEWPQDHLPYSGFAPATLKLSGINISEGLSIDDPAKVGGRDYLFRASGRDLKGANFDFASLPKADFTGAQLQGASFLQTQLQMASLDGAQLQGANLAGAKLQGATLLFAQLQGAVLDSAQLQGALLQGAKLQGAILNSANLQGASLDYAGLQGAWLASTQLQGASLFAANLQGASLRGAKLQGATLWSAQLQGATLQEAFLQATDLSDSLLWRTNAAPPSTVAPAAIRLQDSTKPWETLFWSTSSAERRPWSKESYEELRNTLDSLQSNDLRIQALKFIQRLDCASPDPTLTSCDASEHPSPEAVTWKKSLEGARVDDPTYFRALASVLRALVCVGSGERGGVFTGGRAERLLDYAFMENTLFTLRGLMASVPFNAHLALAGPEAPALVDFIMSKDCPVSASLTNADKARLLQIKQDTMNAGR